MEDKEKLGKRTLKRATRTIDILIEEHCGVKRTHGIIVFFMPTDTYALHVQRKFSKLSDRDKRRMATIGHKIGSRAKVKEMRISKGGPHA